MSRRPRLPLSAVIALCALVGCAQKPVTWDEPERLNADPGALGRFTSPYYNAVHPLPDGGALAVFMRTSGQFKTMVARRAGDARAAFEPEQFLTPENLRDSVSIGPAIATGSDPREVYVVWQSRRLATGDKFVLFRRSGDGGREWSPARTLSSEVTPFVPDIAADPDGAAYVVWSDERGGSLDVFYNRSLDHGQTWLPSDASLEPPGVRGHTALSIAVASDGKGRVVVVWEDELRGGRLLYATSSRDKGATWSAPVRVDDGTTRMSPAAPEVVFASGRVIVVWNSAATGTSPLGQVWSDVSADGGETWGADVLVREAAGGTASRTHLVSDGTTAHLVFHAGRFGKTSHIYHTATTADGGWATRGESLTSLTKGDGQFSNPRLAIDGDGTLYVTYEDGQKRIVLDRSRDHGATWEAEPEVVAATTDQASQARLRYPQLAASGGIVYVTWESWGGGDVVRSSSPVEADTARRAVDLYVRRARFRP